VNLDASLKVWNEGADKYGMGQGYRDAFVNAIRALCSEPTPEAQLIEGLEYRHQCTGEPGILTRACPKCATGVFLRKANGKEWHIDSRIIVPTPTREPLKRWRKYYRDKDGVLRSWMRNVPIAAVLKAEDKKYGVHVFASRQRCVESDGFFRLEAPIIVEVTIPPHARGMENGAAKSNQWTIESWSEVHVDLSQPAIRDAVKLGPEPTPPPACKVGDRVRSKAYPMWGVMEVESCRADDCTCRVLHPPEGSSISVGLVGCFAVSDLSLAAFKIEDLRIGMRVRLRNGQEHTVNYLNRGSVDGVGYEGHSTTAICEVEEILP